MYASSFDFESSLVSQQYIHPLVDEAIMPMKYYFDPTPLLGADAPLGHVVSHFIQTMVEKVVMSMQYSTDPTPPLGG
jgi:hypothetical protein